MPTINELKKKALNDAGYSGDINTAEWKWLKDVCDPYVGTIPDMWRYALTEVGYKNVNDMLIDLGHTGALPNKWYKYWRDTPLEGIGSYQFVNAEAEALVARFSTEPSDARKELIDDLVGALKAAGVWSKLDALYVMAAHNAQAARQNWIQNAYNLTEVSSPTFTADRGYAGDGTGAYLSTGATYNGLAHFSQNSASFGVWARTTINNYPFGAITNPAVVARFDATNMRVNDNTNSNHGLGSAGDRLLSFDRPNSETKKSYSNGSAVGSASVSSGTLGSDAISLLRMVSVYSNTELAVAFFGESLGDAGHAALATSVHDYLQAVGATT